MFVGDYCYTRGAWSVGFDWSLNGVKYRAYNGVEQRFIQLVLGVNGIGLTQDTDYEIAWCIDEKASNTPAYYKSCAYSGYFYFQIRGLGIYSDSVAYLQYQLTNATNTLIPLQSITAINALITENGSAPILIP